jgi:uncharacterized protein
MSKNPAALVDLEGIVDVRCRPPLPEFRAYFEPSRLKQQSARSGAPYVSEAFLTGSVDTFFAEMKSAGIARAVVQGRNSPERVMGTKFNAAFIDNALIGDLQSRYPDVFIGFGGIDVSNTVHDAVAETERCLGTLQLAGIFIEPGRALGCAPDDERIFPVYEACMAANAPVNVMTGPFAGPDIESSHPIHIDRLATRFPALKIICGHGCYPYVNEIIAVAYKHRNVFVSPDMYMFAPGGSGYAEAANRLLKDQMLFGSAYPLLPMEHAVKETAALPLSAEAMHSYLRRNATALLK